MLRDNKDVSRRLETIEIHPSKDKNLILSGFQDAENSESQDSNSAQTVLRTTPPLSSFEQDLYASPVYARTFKENSTPTIPISNRNSEAQSFLSNLSLADISDISVLSLPITTAEIWNHRHYLTERHCMAKTHASGRESCYAMSQIDSRSHATAELKMPLDKFPDARISEDNNSSFVPLKIMLLGAFGLHLSANSPTRVTSAKYKICVGISLAGKTTVLKQLQNLYSGGFTSADREEARVAILGSLLSAFQGAWNRIKYMEDDFEDDAERLLNASDLPTRPGLK